MISALFHLPIMDSKTPINIAPFTNLASREQRYGGFVKLNYQPFPWLKLYEEFYANHLEETSQVAPTPVASTDGITVPAANPNNPFGVDLTPNGWRISGVQNKVLEKMLWTSVFGLNG
jgi:hypothetical protein